MWTDLLEWLLFLFFFFSEAAAVVFNSTKDYIKLWTWVLRRLGRSEELDGGRNERESDQKESERSWNEWDLGRSGSGKKL